ncbi:MBOAT family O-acyltransferase [Chloroflexota bacterium]
MQIISFDFLFFVSISLAIFYLLPGKLQNPFLLLASYYYYSTWSWNYLIVLLLLTVFNYFYARPVRRAGRKKPYVLWAGIGVNLVIFAVFLFGDFLTPGLNGLAALFSEGGFELRILLPLGFSYYVLECISYLVDVQLRVTKPGENIIDFALYLAYFPKLISGPIERWRKFGAQLREKRIVDNQLLARSLILVLVGLIQSVILGGLFTVLAPTFVLDKPESFAGLQLLLALVVYSFYLYNQFSGYTKIVRGVSGFFGIELSRNFAYPFFSKDFSDFWNRWHISLSQWLRDYVYLPRSRALLRRNPSRTNKANLIVPPMATMLSSGLWHGASLNLILWGALNGFYIVIENLLNLFRPVSPDARPPWYRRAFSTALVLGLGLVAAIPFRMDLATSKIFLYQLTKGFQLEMPDLRPLLIMAATLGLDWLQFRHDDEFVFLKWPRWAQALSAALAVFFLIVVYNLQNAPTTFVYP